MPVATERQSEHIGETCQPGCSVQDLVQVFNGLLNNVWRYDQYIANAEGNQDLQNFWRNQKRQDQQSCTQIRQLLVKELQR